MGFTAVDFLPGEPVGVGEEVAEEGAEEVTAKAYSMLPRSESPAD